MTEEIKELLDILNKVKDYDDKRYFISCGENDYLLTNDEIKCLLNYITNLQKENEELKELCDKYEEEHSKAFKLWTMKMEEMPDYEEKIKYKSRNEKASDFILSKAKEYKPHFAKVELNTADCNELLNILEGGDE